MCGGGCGRVWGRLAARALTLRVLAAHTGRGGGRGARCERATAAARGADTWDEGGNQRMEGS